MGDSATDAEPTRRIGPSEDGEDEASEVGHALAKLRDDGDDARAQREKADIRARLLGAEPPRRVIGRYTVTGRLGAGGMGEVLAAHDPTLDRPVAIKLLHVELHGDGEEHRARMIREAKTLAKLSHPNVVQIYEVGEAEGRVFLAMELVRGASLRRWQARERPGWRQVLACYLEAGRGLSAVHRAGLVHRDFKPDNVLVGEDGRVCVADFGLARHAARSSASLSSSSAASSAEDATLGSDARASASDGEPSEARLTRTGRVAGTPAYMAPEQLRGAEIDAQADQFGFCVALYEGLYGQRPFAGQSLGRLVASHAAGPSAPPRRSPVPRRLWRVLARGLAERPEERFGSMDALLRALDPARARRRRLLALGVGLGVPIVAASIALLRDAGPRCEVDATALAETWDEGRRERARSAFLATGLPFAEQAFHGVDEELARWSGAWLDARRAACEATHVEGTQSPERLDARVACLERERRDVAARTRVLAEADARIVGRSDRVLAPLPDVTACADPAVLEQAAPRPSDREQARAVETARDELARASALIAAGDLRRAEALSAELRPVAESLGHPPLSLEVEALEAELSLARDALDRGIPALLAVARRAEALRLDELAATTRVRLAVAACGKWSRPEQEQWLLDEADAAVARVGRPEDPRRLALALAEGNLAIDRGDYDVAIEIHRRAAAAARERGDEVLAEAQLGSLMVALQRRGDHERARAEGMAALSLAQARYGERSPVAGDRHFDLGLLALEQGRLEDAEEQLGLAHAILAEAFGPASLDAARARFAGVKLSMSRGELDVARGELERLVPIYQRELGPEHVETAQVWNAQGVLLYFAGEHAASVEAYRRALSVQRRVLGPEHEEVGLLLSNIGESQLGLGEPAEALASFDEALEIMQRTLPERHRLLALPAKGRGLALLALGRADEAVVELERALAIHDAGAGEPIEHAETRWALARALRPRDAERARVLAMQARDDFHRLGLDDRREVIDHWLAEPSPTKEQSTP